MRRQRLEVNPAPAAKGLSRSDPAPAAGQRPGTLPACCHDSFQQPFDMIEVAVETEKRGSMFHRAGGDPHVVDRNRRSLSPQLAFDLSEPFGCFVRDRDRHGPRLLAKPAQGMPVLLLPRSADESVQEFVCQYHKLLNKQE